MARPALIAVFSLMLPAGPALSGSLSSVTNPAYNLEKTSRQVPFVQAGNSMIVQGAVNGVNTSFIVDTGASLVVIPPGLAREAKISTDSAPRVMLQTANGRIDAPMVLIDSLKVAGLEQRNVSAVVQAVSSDGRTALLGMNFLNLYRMSVDHDRRMLILEKK